MTEACDRRTDVDRPPVHFSYSLEVIRLQDLRSGLNKYLRRNLGLIDSVRLPVDHVDIRYLDVKADQVAFTWYNENAPVCRVNHGSRANIRKVSLRDEVHDAPHEF